MLGASPDEQSQLSERLDLLTSTRECALPMRRCRSTGRNRQSFRLASICRLAALLALWPATTVEAGTIADDVQAVYGEADYQTNLPGINEPLPQSTENEEPLEQEVSPGTKELVRLILFVLKWLAIIAVAAGAIYAVAMAFRAWRERQRGPRRTDLLNARLASDTANGEPLSVTTSFSDAERLAQQGAYGEAIHALLLAVIEALFVRSDRPIPLALTGRELIGLTRLNEAPRREFADLVARSEHSHFGGRPADRSAFDACYRQAIRLIDAMGGA